MVLSTIIEGETREIAGVHAAIAKEILASGRPVRAPACLLSGGETTVTVRGKGLGGRNQEFVLAARSRWRRRPGHDLQRGHGRHRRTYRRRGRDRRFLDVSRARALVWTRGGFWRTTTPIIFSNHGRAVKTGPTGTNVMDVRVLLVG